MHYYCINLTALHIICLMLCETVTRWTLCRHIRYIGQSDIGDKSRNTLIRSCLDIGTSVNIGKFLSEMGFM